MRDVLACDDEFEQLCQRAKDILGEDVYHDALRRAMTIAVQRGRPVDPESWVGRSVDG